MIEPTHDAESKIVQDAGTGLLWGQTATTATVPFLIFLEPLSSQADADRFGVDLERRYRLHVDLADEDKIPQGAVLRAKPFRSGAWTYYRVEKPGVRHEAGDEADHVEAAVERLEKFAGW